MDSNYGGTESFTWMLLNKLSACIFSFTAFPGYHLQAMLYFTERKHSAMDCIFKSVSSSNRSREGVRIRRASCSTSKLRLISERVNDLPWSSSVAEDTAMRAPAMVYLKSLEAQLQDFKANIPSELSDNSKSLSP